MNNHNQAIIGLMRERVSEGRKASINVHERMLYDELNLLIDECESGKIPFEFFGKRAQAICSEFIVSTLSDATAASSDKLAEQT